MQLNIITKIQESFMNVYSAENHVNNRYITYNKLLDKFKKILASNYIYLTDYSKKQIIDYFAVNKNNSEIIILNNTYKLLTDNIPNSNIRCPNEFAQNLKNVTENAKMNCAIKQLNECVNNMQCLSRYVEINEETIQYVNRLYDDKNIIIKCLSILNNK